MKCSYRQPRPKRTAALLIVTALLFLSPLAQARECMDVASYLDDILSKKDLQISAYERAYRANSPTFNARSQRYTKPGYQAASNGERAKLISEIVEGAADQKAVFDLRLNAKAEDLVPMLKANRSAQIVDPKIVDGKLVAKLNGSADELSYTVEIPLEAIDNFAYWKGAARTGDRQVVSFADSSGKALEDFMKSVGPGKSPEDYTKAFKELGSDWNYQNDILAALDKKVAAGQTLTKDEFALAMMVERNRTQAAPARLNQLLAAYDGRASALKGSAPNAEALLKDIPMDASMRARAQRLLSSVEGERLPPAVIVDSSKDVAVRGAVSDRVTPIKEISIEDVSSIADQSPKRLTPERPQVEYTADGVPKRGEILHDSDLGPRPGSKDVTPSNKDEVLQALTAADEAPEVTTDIVSRLEEPELNTIVIEETPRITDQSPKRLTPERPQVEYSEAGVQRRGEILHDSDPGPRPGSKDITPGTTDDVVQAGTVADDIPDTTPRITASSVDETPPRVTPERPLVSQADDVPPRVDAGDTPSLTAADDALEGAAKTAPEGGLFNMVRRGWGRFRDFLRSNQPKVVRTATTTGRVVAAMEDRPDPETPPAVTDPALDGPEQPGLPANEDGDDDPADDSDNGTLSDDQTREAIGKVNLAANLVEETKLRPVWEMKLEASAIEDTPEVQEILTKGNMSVTCQKTAGVPEGCSFDGKPGDQKFTKKYKRLLDSDYVVDVRWEYKSSESKKFEVTQIFTVPMLNCDDVAEDDKETEAACFGPAEDEVPSFKGVTGPQLLPMPQMPQLRQRGVYITPGFN